MENEANKRDVDYDLVVRMQNMLKEYESAKEQLRIASIDNNDKAITVDKVFELIDKLYRLKNYGKKIRQLRESQESVRIVEMSMGDREVRYDPRQAKQKIPIEKPKPAPKPRTKSANKFKEDEQEDQRQDINSENLC